MNKNNINYQDFADTIFATFCKMSDFNGYQTMIVDQSQDKVQVFDMALARNGFAIFPKTGEYSLFTTDTGWSNRQPIFTTLEVLRAGQLGADWERQLDMLKLWVSRTTS